MKLTYADSVMIINDAIRMGIFLTPNQMKIPEGKIAYYNKKQKGWIAKPKESFYTQFLTDYKFRLLILHRMLDSQKDCPNISIETLKEIYSDTKNSEPIHFTKGDTNECRIKSKEKSYI